jgi:hypothetical protein
MPDKAQDIGQLTGLGVAGLELAGAVGVGGLESGVGILATTGAVPIVGAIVGIGVGVYELLKALGVGKGCGQSCIEGSEYEQVFEAAAQDVWQFARHGLLSKSQTEDVLQQILDAGQQTMSEAPGLSQSRIHKSSANMTRTIMQFINAAASMPEGGYPSDGTTPQSLQNTEIGKWYSVSVAKGHQLALALYEQAVTAPGAVPSMGHTAAILRGSTSGAGSGGGFLASLGGPNCSICKPVLYLVVAYFGARALKLI